MKKATKKASMLSKQKNVIIVAAIAFAILLAVYFIVVKPMLADGSEQTSEKEAVWKGEKTYLMFEEITRDDVLKVKIHNPKNDAQFVDWGFFRCTEDGQKTPDGYEMIKDETYLLGYEYAPYDDEMMASLATDARFPVFRERVIAHCPDEKFSEYGLISNTELEAYLNATTDEEREKALENFAYYTITAIDGRTHTVVIGDRLLSGAGNYVRVLDEDTCIATGETMVRDSVYCVKYNFLMGTPLALVTTELGYPTNPQIHASSFNEFLVTDMVVKRDENGNPVLDENGETTLESIPRIALKAIGTVKNDSFTQFASMVSYKVILPAGGYYGSASFDEVFSLFAECKGDEVVALGKLMTTTDENGKEVSYIGFEDETYEKYCLDGDITVIYYTYDLTPTIDDDDPIETYINVSPLQADGYYYVYSMLYNTICRVSPATLYFLDWDATKYIQTEIFQLKIDNSSKIEVSGKYFDFNEDNDLPAGLRDVNLTFSLTETVGDLIVNGADNLDKTQKVCDTDNFRELYKLLLQIYLKEEVSKEVIEDVMKDEPFATIRIETRDQPVYKTDSEGNETGTVDYIMYSVVREFKFYRLSNGRALCTIKDEYFKTDSDGKIVYEEVDGVKKPVVLETEERGNFYVVTSRVEQVMDYAQAIYNGIEVDANIRG